MSASTAIDEIRTSLGGSKVKIVVVDEVSMMRAADCITHTRCVAAFRKLPSTYPSGHKWSAEDNKHYQPITKDILKGITQELTS